MSANFKPALSTCNKTIDESLFKAYHDAGICAMELSMKFYADWDFEEFKRLADKYNITLWSLHIPFAPLDEYEISDEAIADKTIEYAKGIIKKANTVGIKTYIIHPSGEPIEECDRQKRIQRSVKSLKILCDYADTLGCTIAVENLPRTCLGRNSDEMLALLSAHEKLGMCFDTNHLLGQDPIEFIKAVGNRIVTTHVSDYDFINERHWLPGEGKMPWVDVIKALEEVGYKGYLLYEVDFAARWSISRDRDLTCEDFKKNFNELTSYKQPTRIGIPKENLGMWDFVK